MLTFRKPGPTFASARDAANGSAARPQKYALFECAPAAEATHALLTRVTTQRRNSVGRAVSHRGRVSVTVAEAETRFCPECNDFGASFTDMPAQISGGVARPAVRCYCLKIWRRVPGESGAAVQEQPRDHSPK